MAEITISISEKHAAHLATVAKRHQVRPEILAAAIVEKGIEGEDVRRELRCLRADLALLAQAVLLGTKMASEEDARAWAKREFLKDFPP
jgi:hypothetical protein